MPNSRLILKQIHQFQERDLFSTSAWQARGLNPSGSDRSRELTIFFHDVARELARAVAADGSTRRLKAIFADARDQLPKTSYDTEEREFIADLFIELAGIVGIDIRGAMNRWLYGPAITALLAVGRFLRPERIIATRSQLCTQCNTALEMQILRKREDFPNTDWLIVRCKQCNELNLLSSGPGIGRFRFVHCEWVEGLPKQEYTYEQALSRLEQIKYFRK